MKEAKVAKKKSGGQPKPGGRVTGKVVVMCSEPYESYFDEIATDLRCTRAGAFDRILYEWCESTGRKLPPKRI